MFLEADTERLSLQKFLGKAGEERSRNEVLFGISIPPSSLAHTTMYCKQVLHICLTSRASSTHKWTLKDTAKPALDLPMEV